MQIANNEDDMHKVAIRVILNQMNAKKSIKLFEETCVTVMLNEYQQLHDMEVFGKLNPDVLTNIHNRQALRAIDIIKKKRCGIIKGNTCTDSWPQINYT